MVSKKYFHALMVIILLFACFSTVNASDLNDTTQSLSSDDINLITNDSGFNNEVIGASSPGTFNDLSEEINDVEAGGVLNLTRDYVYSSGDSAIVIDKAFTINGNGFKIDGGRSSQIFTCYGPDEKTFNNIIFCNGYANSNSEGGGAVFSRSPLTLNNCIFENNSVYGDKWGVALYCPYDILLDNCTFKNNYRRYDNAVSSAVNARVIVVKNSKFFDNGCTSIGAGSNLNVSNSVFMNNKDVSIYSIQAKDTDIKNCTFMNNEAFANPGASSAIQISARLDTVQNVKLEDCKFINNSGSGSAVCLGRFNGFLNNCEFINNSGYSGGGLECAFSNLSLKNLKFISNSVGEIGGAISSFYSYVKIDSVDFINNSANMGGAIYYWNCENSSIISCNFIDNTANEGGAIYNWNLRNNYIENSFFSGNSQNNAEVISFDNKFSESSNESYFTSKISNCIFDTYDDLYGGSFSFKDNILTVTSSYDEFSGDITVVIGGKTFKKSIDSQGSCSIDLSSVPIGVYDAKVIYSGGSGLAPCEITMPLSIESFTFSVPDVTKNYGGPERLDITLMKSGSPIVNENVDISINGVTYTRTTDSNGRVSMAINLDSGVYDAVVTYKDITKISKVTVNPFNTDTHLDVYKTSRDSYFVNITVANSSDGDKVIVKLITAKGATKEYECILNNFKASISLYDLDIATYVMNVTYHGDINHISSSDWSNLHVSGSPIVVSSSDVVKYYKGPERLEIKFIDEHNHLNIPIYNATAYITINGVKYTRTTDVNGTISMGINLNSGFYTALIQYSDDSFVESHITVKPTVYGNDTTANYGDVKYSANFMDSNGNPLAKGVATFKINSNVYYSDISDGIATIIIHENHGPHIVEVTNPLTGETNTNNINITPVETKTVLSGVKDIDADSSLTITAEVNSSVGSVTFNVNSTSKTVNLVNNKTSYTIDDLYPGTYLITAIYKDSKGNYLSSSDFASFNVSKVKANLSVTADDIGAGQNAVFEVTLNDDATGEVSVLINNKTYKNRLYDGKTLISVPDLDVCNYTYIASYDGDTKYNATLINGNISVFIINVKLNASDLVKYYGSQEKLTAQLLDKSDNPLSGQKIIFTVNNNDYERITDNLGFASMNINLNSGNYTAGVKFAGNNVYDSIKTTVLIEIKPTVMAKDLSKIFRNATQYYATFVDSQGNILKNTNVSFNINGVFYNRTTNESGAARLNINLNPGEYILTAKNPSTGEFITTIVTVLPSIVEANNLTKYYKNESQYTLKILDDYGNPVCEGVAVKLNINGVFYERKTNSSGYINMNINLNSGTYIITAEYNDLRVSNTIEVLPILEAKNLSMKYKDGSKFEVKLLDGEGNPFAGQIITLNINGVFYNRTTAYDGIARLNINLMPGEYIITSMYENGAALSNKITIRS